MSLTLTHVSNINVRANSNRMQLLLLQTILVVGALFMNSAYGESSNELQKNWTRTKCKLPLIITDDINAY